MDVGYAPEAKVLHAVLLLMMLLVLLLLLLLLLQVLLLLLLLLLLSRRSSSHVMLMLSGLRLQVLCVVAPRRHHAAVLFGVAHGLRRKRHVSRDKEEKIVARVKERGVGMGARTDGRQEHQHSNDDDDDDHKNNNNNKNNKNNSNKTNNKRHHQQQHHPTPAAADSPSCIHCPGLNGPALPYLQQSVTKSKSYNATVLQCHAAQTTQLRMRAGAVLQRGALPPIRHAAHHVAPACTRVRTRMRIARNTSRVTRHASRVTRHKALRLLTRQRGGGVGRRREHVEQTATGICRQGEGGPHG